MFFSLKSKISRRKCLQALQINNIVWNRMCVTFFYQSEIRPSSGYWLVLANNRDEVWNRPTKTADFWGEKNKCICGRDETPGKQGGTWLGMNTDGKVGVLVNILGQFDESKEGRGHLITDYLSSNIDLPSYSQSVLENKDRYNGFNLVLFDLGNDVDSIVHKPLYMSNSLSYPSSLHFRTLPANTFHGLSNSPMEYPFQKVEKGKAKFRDIVSQYEALSQKQYLIEGLFDLMQDPTPLLPDPILERAAAKAAYSPMRTRQHSAIKVVSPQDNYGTRISTVIIVDGQGHVDYIERTADFVDGNEVSAATNQKQFNLSITDQNENASKSES